MCCRARRARRVRAGRAGHTGSVGLVGFVGRVDDARDGRDVWDAVAWRVCSVFTCSSSMCVAWLCAHVCDVIVSGVS